VIENAPLTVDVARLLGANVPFATSFKCLACSNSRLPRAVSVSLTLPIPAAENVARPLATKTGLAFSRALLPWECRTTARNVVNGRTF
jgi:hypothetical protein